MDRDFGASSGSHFSVVSPLSFDKPSHLTTSLEDHLRMLLVWLTEVGNPHNQHWRYSSAQVRSLQAIGPCLETTSKVPLFHILFLPHTSTDSFGIGFSPLGIPKYIPSE